MLKFSRIVVASITILTASAAHAKEWYILDAPRDRCLLAAQAPAQTGINGIVSPAEFADQVRREGRTPTVKIAKDAAGSIIEADVADRGSVLSWFPNEQLCLEAKAIAEKAGEIVPPNELR